MSHEKKSVLHKDMSLPKSSALMLVGFSIPVLVLLYVNFREGELGPFGVLLSAFLLGTLVLAVLCFLPKGAWVYGVELKDDGFVFRQPLRRTRFIHYASIERIVVKSMLDGWGWSASRLHIRSCDGSAWLTEEVLYETPILQRLQDLPGFLHGAWGLSDVPENSLKWSFMQKKTVVFEKNFN